MQEGHHTGSSLPDPPQPSSRLLYLETGGVPGADPDPRRHPNSSATVSLKPWESIQQLQPLLQATPRLHARRALQNLRATAGEL